MDKSTIIAEESPNKVGAVFSSATAAESVMTSLSDKTGIHRNQIMVIKPGDKCLEQKLEPESHNIWRTLVRSHLWMGAIGLSIGVLFAVALLMIDVPALVYSPLYGIVILGVLGALLGLMVGGLISLRPDHDLMILRAKEVTGKGRWFLVVHAKNLSQQRSAKSILNQVSDDVVASL